MDATLSLLLLLFKSSLLVLGASVRHGLDQHCPAITTISEIDKWAIIANLQKGNENIEGDLFVHPDPGFRGINLVAVGNDGWRDEAYFTLHSTCFRQNAEWWMLNVFIMRDWGIYDNNDDALAFQVAIGGCNLVCRRRGRFRGAMAVYVNSHGPSRWRINHPAPCSVTDPSPPMYETNTCRNTPTTTTTTTTTVTTTTEKNPTTTTTTTTITTATPTITLTAIIITTVVLVMIGVVVVVVVVVLVVVNCVRQRRQQSTEAPRVPHRRGLAASWVVGSQVAEIDMGGEEHTYDDVAAPATCRQYENVDHSEDEYLTPRRAPPGTPIVVMKDEELIYDDNAAPATCRRYENVGLGNDAYLNPRRAPTATPLVVMEDEEHIYDEF